LLVNLLNKDMISVKVENWHLNYKRMKH